ncbi:unnamed protein product [Strongylus vulgaris]|uniref:Uncharacterized protein n=1 Tax=Strongylus vulgaris TaxID=40348 RepID=A0A3P7IYF2_STRVU|nr:unnamed protein product [Strongylus vulgaris]
MPSPRHYPDGTLRSPRILDDDDEIEPAYFRAARSRSQSAMPAVDDEEER